MEPPDIALARLKKLADDSDASVRLKAVEELATLPWRSRLDVLWHVTHDADERIVAVAADALAFARDRRARPILRELLGKKEWRFEALEGFFELRDEEVIPFARVLAGAFFIPAHEKAMAALILARNGEAEALEHVRRRAMKKRAVERPMILFRLAEADLSEGPRILESIANDPNDPQRETALLALARLDPKRWWSAAAKLLDESPAADEILLSLADIDLKRALPLAKGHGELREKAAMMDSYPDEVLLRCD